MFPIPAGIVTAVPNTGRDGVTTPIATILPSERIGEQYTRITAYWGVLPVTLGIPTEISRSRVVSHLKSAGTADEGSY